MALPVPQLDDRRFEDIFREARGLIPRYAPEWTDHNLSDPGITLIELFAWMTEMMLYRVNQIPELHHRKFLDLIGIKLRPAEPARAELTFSLSRPDLQSVIVPLGTQVAAPDPAGEIPVVFETDEALVALGAGLTAIQTFDGFGYSIETTKNGAEGQWFFPFGRHSREGAAIMLGFDSPLAFTDEQINLAVFVSTEGLKREGRHCDLDLAAAPLAVDLAWEYWDKIRWEPISLDRDDTRAFTRSGHIYLRGPGARVKKDTLGSVKDSLYWFRCRLVKGAYETSPRVEGILTNTVLATQAVTHRDEVLGGTTGRPNQEFQLADAPVLVRSKPEVVTNPDNTRALVHSLRLEIDEGQGLRVWQEVDDFLDSGPESEHFTLDRATGEIRLGNGANGRIARANAANPSANVIARLYRTNLPRAVTAGAGAISELQSFVESVASVTNRRPALAGRPAETLEDAKRRAPRALQSKERAVTGADFEFLAEETPGVHVRRAKALPLRHPRFGDVDIPGSVTVIVVPDSEAPNPLPSEATLKTVCQHLNNHRLLTSEVHVVAPRYHHVKIQASVIVKPDDDLAEVKKGVESGLTTYFHPLRGGDRGEGWEFGGPIHYSEVYRVILQTRGVARIRERGLVIWLDDEPREFCSDAETAPGALLYSDEHDIRVSYVD